MTLICPNLEPFGQYFIVARLCQEYDLVKYIYAIKGHETQLFCQQLAAYTHRPTKNLATSLVRTARIMQRKILQYP
jgi:hypothetical protein